MDTSYIYDNIRKRRLELEMSLDELAEKVGYSNRSMMSKVERGLVDVPIQRLVVIAEALKIDFIELVRPRNEV